MTTRRGHTLVEAVVSLGVVGVLAAAIGSAMLLAARSAPREDDAVSRTLVARRVADRIAADLALATSIDERSDHVLVLRLADQDADGTAEHVAWAWSGTPGDALRRVQNGVVTHVYDDVHAFAIDWTTGTTNVSTPTAPTHGSEVLLATFDDSNDSTIRLSASTQAAQYILPTLPADATHYTITRARVRVTKSDLISGTMMARMCRPAASGDPLLPADATSSALLSLNLLPGSWINFNFSSGVSNIPAGEARWLVIYQSLLPFVDLLVQRYVAHTTSHMGVTTDAGTTWSTRHDSTLRYELYGTIRRPGSAMVGLIHATGATVQVALGSSSTRAGASASLPARPPLPSLSAEPIEVDIREDEATIDDVLKLTGSGDLDGKVDDPLGDPPESPKGGGK